MVKLRFFFVVWYYIYDTGIVGKWGATSFTSVRTTSDNSNTAKPRQNKFFKSRAENSENTTEVKA